MSYRSNGQSYPKTCSFLIMPLPQEANTTQYNQRSFVVLCLTPKQKERNKVNRKRIFSGLLAVAAMSIAIVAPTANASTNVNLGDCTLTIYADSSWSAEILDSNGYLVASEPAGVAGSYTFEMGPGGSYNYFTYEGGIMTGGGQFFCSHVAPTDPSESVNYVSDVLGLKRGPAFGKAVGITARAAAAKG